MKIIHERCNNFKYDKCSKSFGQKAHMLTHIITIHEGDKEFQYKKCPKAFVLNYDLQKNCKKSRSTINSF